MEITEYKTEDKYLGIPVNIHMCCKKQCNTLLVHTLQNYANKYLKNTSMVKPYLLRDKTE